MKNERNYTIDIMKFILIIMMVWSHSGFPTTFIYIFNMPVFFMISGIFIKDITSFSEFKRFTWKKICTVYFPYILTNLIFLVFHNLFVKIGFYTNNPEILDFFPDFKLYDYYTLKDFVKRFILIIFFVGGTQMGGATWFLRALFFSSILFCIFDVIFSKLEISKKINLHFFVGIVLLVIAFGLRNLEKNILMWVRQCMVPYIFFPIGKILYSKQEMLLRKKISIVFFAISLVVLVILCNFKIHKINEGIVFKPIAFLVGAISGYIFVFTISSVLSKLKIKSLLALFGQNTLYVLSLHFFVSKFINLLFVHVKNLPNFVTASFPSCYRLCETYKEKIIYGGGYIILGVFVPISLGIIKNKIIRFRLKRSIEND